MAAPQMPMIKISVSHSRDKSRDEETWIKWYLEEHIPRFTPLAHKHGIDKFELYITPDTFKQQFQADLDNLKGGAAQGWNMLPHDATTVYWVSDPQKLRNLMADPEFKKTQAFEEGWIDQHKVDVQVGTETTFIENGKIVNTVTKEYD